MAYSLLKDGVSKSLEGILSAKMCVEYVCVCVSSPVCVSDEEVVLRRVGEGCAEIPYDGGACKLWNSLHDSAVPFEGNYAVFAADFTWDQDAVGPQMHAGGADL